MPFLVLGWIGIRLGDTKTGQIVLGICFPSHVEEPLGSDFSFYGTRLSGRRWQLHAFIGLESNRFHLRWLGLVGNGIWAFDCDDISRREVPTFVNGGNGEKVACSRPGPRGPYPPCLTGVGRK